MKRCFCKICNLIYNLNKIEHDLIAFQINRRSFTKDQKHWVGKQRSERDFIPVNK